MTLIKVPLNTCWVPFTAYTVLPRSLVHFYITTLSIKTDKTFLACSSLSEYNYISIESQFFLQTKENRIEYPLNSLRKICFLFKDNTGYRLNIRLIQLEWVPKLLVGINPETVLLSIEPSKFETMSTHPQAKKVFYVRPI